MKRKKLVVGFDGFVDSIARPASRAGQNGAPVGYYPTISGFGGFLQQVGKSCSIELSPLQKRPGGNAPLLSMGAAALGMDVTCIGMLGENGPDPVFSNMPCRLFSYAAPGEALALEFDDGKVFFAAGPAIESDTIWQRVDDACGSAAAEEIRQADVLALVNWSELPFAHRLWEDVLMKALLPEGADKQRTVLFDLCDCTRRSTEEIGAVLQLVNRFGQRRNTLLSLNANEAEIVGERLLEPDLDLSDIAHKLRSRYSIDEVLVHTKTQNLLVNGRGVTLRENSIVEKPAISTGAGDHFNAAICRATAGGLPDDERLAYATRFAAYYITHGMAAGFQAN